MRVLAFVWLGSAILRSTERARLQVALSEEADCFARKDPSERCATLCKQNTNCEDICREVQATLCAGDATSPAQMDTTSASMAAAAAAANAVKDSVRDAIRQTQEFQAQKFEVITNATKDAIKATMGVTEAAATRAVEQTAGDAAKSATAKALTRADQIASVAATAAVRDTEPPSPVLPPPATPVEMPPITAAVAAAPMEAETPLLEAGVDAISAVTAPAPAPASAVPSSLAYSAQGAEQEMAVP